MAEIREVVSESLQATVRRLLPSQRGFTEDLQATNVITPIIDLTPTAEGSFLPEYLQRAVNFTDANTFSVFNTTSTIINNAGFWQINASVSHNIAAGAANLDLVINDGTTDKTLLNFGEVVTSSANEIFFFYLEYPIILVRPADIVKIVAGSGTTCVGSARQIADINGNLNDPSGYQSS